MLRPLGESEVGVSKNSKVFLSSQYKLELVLVGLWGGFPFPFSFAAR